MKIAASSGKPSKKAELIIPLEDDEAHHKLTKENSVTWELRTIPNDNNSPTYKVQARILSGWRRISTPEGALDERCPEGLRWS